jgi:hypothetical protein
VAASPRYNPTLPKELTTKRFFSFALVSLVALLALAPAAAQEKKEAGMTLSAIPSSPEWQQLRSLAGEWQGTVAAEGRPATTTVEVRVTGGGSALMHVLDKDTPHEMVTMFHPDGKRLLATHYCAARNQPRMAMVKSPAPNQIAFEFVDGTNLQPGDTRMQRLVLTFKDNDHHDETWVAIAGGKENTLTFSYARKK